jgi:ATP-dependent Clp protease ATP-binding subunit ClpA
MNPGLSIQLIWPIAAQEAIVADFEFIEPPHLFNAILKFSELRKDQIESIAKEKEAVKVFLSERDLLCSKLEETSIKVPGNSTPIRRKLREKMGKGTKPYNGQRIIHRSEASREICKKAEEIALAEGRSNWHSIHLLQALIEEPSSQISEALDDAGVLNLIPKQETPIIDKYCKNLCSEAEIYQADKESDTIDSLLKDPVCKVVIDSIKSLPPRNTFLIHNGKRSPTEIMQNIARLIIENSAPSGIKGYRILEIRMSKLIKNFEIKTKWEDELISLIQEANQIKKNIIFISDLDQFIETDFWHQISFCLTDTSSPRLIPCFIGIKGDQYSKFIKDDATWKKLHQKIWIHELEIPLQL